MFLSCRQVLEGASPLRTGKHSTAHYLERPQNPETLPETQSTQYTHFMKRSERPATPHLSPRPQVPNAGAGKGKTTLMKFSMATPGGNLEDVPRAGIADRS